MLATSSTGILQLAVLSSLFAGQATSSEQQGGETNDLAAVMGGNPSLSTFYGLLSKSPDILVDISHHPNVTFIVPNNDAFEDFKGLDFNNASSVNHLLAYHILSGTLFTKYVEEGIPEFAGTLLHDGATGTNMTGGQRVIVNKQWGSQVFFTTGRASRSNLVDGDIGFSGGLIQIVDTVLVPPPRLEPTCRDSYRDLRAFLGAVYQTGLTDYFASAKDVTIFAPQDAAFQLTSGALASLPPSDLRNVLSYHIIPNHVLYSTDMMEGATWTTPAYKNGTDILANLTITVARNSRYVDASQIDILITNGVVHVIANVLNPFRAGGMPELTLMTQSPAFNLTGATATGLKVPVPFTSALPCTVDCPISKATTIGLQLTNTHEPSKSKAGAAEMPKCTGFAGAMGAGVVGLGMLGAAGVL